MAWDLEITANSKYRAIATESCKLYIHKLVRINLLAKKFCGFCRKIYASKICIFMIDNKKKSETVLRFQFHFTRKQLSEFFEVIAKESLGP